MVYLILQVDNIHLIYIQNYYKTLHFPKCYYIISQTADLLRFSPTKISTIYREWYEKEEISRKRQFCGRKCLVYARGQRRM